MTIAVQNAPETIQYLGSTLDRAAERRKDPRWLDERLHAPDSLIVPVWGSKNLIAAQPRAGGDPKAVHLRRRDVASNLEAATEMAFLGLQEDTAVFAIDLTDAPAGKIDALPGGGTFVDLRRVGQLMAQPEAALLAYARGLMHWHRHHRHCARCGHPTESHHGGHMRRCTNDPCQGENYPRTDPAVIMLVEEATGLNRPRRCLLGRRPEWAPGVFSTLAGFVEPGESLEETVAREVLEEAGVRVSKVRYMASQPWPFPSSIMLGFRATADGTKIEIDRDELDDARWFTADELRSAGEWGDESTGLQLPRRDSIARYLIESWLATRGD